MEKYAQNSYLTEIETTITERGKDEIGNFVCLRETVVYPGGGGQPADCAWIAGNPILKIQKTADSVFYYLDIDVETLPEKVLVKINWGQRFDFMQQHTGQHILARVCEDLFQARITKEQMTLKDSFFEIDVKLDKTQLQTALKRSNEIIRAQKQVSILFPTEEELAKETLFTAPPKYFKDLRLIKIADFDIIGCGGTHVKNTAEVQAIALTQVKEHKKTTTLHFACGNRLLQQFETNQKQLTALTLQANVPVDGLALAFQEQQQTIKFYQGQVALYQVNELVANAKELTPHFIYSEITDTEAKELQTAAKKIAEIYPDKLICTATSDEDSLRYHLYLKTADPKRPIGQVIRTANQKFAGRGGGSPTKGDGTIPYLQKDALLRFLQQ